MYKYSYNIFNFYPNRVAESKKEEGNKLYKQKQYNEALKHYSAAIGTNSSISAYPSVVN